MMNEQIQSVSQNGENSRKARILFVDDEPNILNALRWLFKRDYELHFANNGNEAIRAIRNHKFDVVVSDQRMPGITGIEVLHEAMKVSPASMRILLTGYSDMQAVIGSVNEGEVFRFVTKPWINEELKTVLRLAAETALTEPVVHDEPSLEGVALPDKAAVLVIDQDEAVIEQLSDILGGRYALYVTDALDEALSLLDEHDIHVVVSETRIGNTDLTTLIKLLKKHHPDIISVVMTEHSDVDTIIELINQGQVYRFLQKPVKPGQCRLSIQSAMIRHAQLRENPELTKRYAVEDIDEEKILTAASKRHDQALSNRGMLQRLFSRISGLKRLFAAA